MTRVDPKLDVGVERAIARVKQRMFGGVRRPVMLGRFEIVAQLGEGGMGVVYEAIDPTLHRHVALKVVRAAERSERARARLLHEARTIARLSHPNIVTIYDVGTFDAEVYIAMEMVDGCSLREWTRREQPARERLVAMYLAAGEALAVAHEAGVVHRDFKPDNVMVGSDGRPRVLDFGLAQAVAPSETSGDSIDTAVVALPTPRLTMTGAVLGTPAYMAPEQFRGHVDARTDQFAWCVAMFEALAGVRPFVGDSADEIRRLADRGRLDWSVLREPLPAALKRALARGLQPDPTRRFATMRELLRSIEARRRRTVPIAIGAAALVAVAALATRDPADRSVVHDPQSTSTAVAMPEGVAERLATARASIGTGAFADALAPAREAWQIAHDAAAPHAEVEALAVLGTAYTRLADPAGARTLEDALWLALEIGDDQRVAEVGTELVYLAGYVARDLPAAEQWAEVTSAAIGRLGDPIELRAGYHSNLGAAMHIDGRLREARLHYELALTLGSTALGRTHAKVAKVDLNLAALDRVEGRVDEAIARLETILAEQRPILGTHPDIALALANLATARLAAGQNDRAVPELEAAIDMYAETIDPECVQIAQLSSTLGLALAEIGRHDDAVVRHRTAARLLERIHGRDHPEVARALTNLAHTWVRVGESGKAREVLERALVIRETNAPDDRVGMASTHRLLGEIAWKEHDVARARRGFEAAVQLLADASGASAIDLAMARLGLAEVELADAHPSLAATLASEACPTVANDGTPEARERCSRALAATAARD